VYTHEVARRLVKWGHEVSLICGAYSGAKTDEYIDGVSVHRTGGRIRVYLDAPFIYMRKFQFRVDAVIDEINTIPWFTPLYVPGKKIAFVHQLAREVLFYELPPIFSNQLYKIEPTFYKFYRNIPVITVSESTKHMLEKFGIPSEHIRIIPNGLNPIHLHEKIRKSENPLIAYVGRVVKFKILQTAIKAMARVVKEVPSAKLVIAGRGYEDYYSELKQLASRLNLSKNVEFIGPVSVEEKRRLLGSAWVFVYTSILEGWGQTVIEANALGTPAIAYDVPGLRDAVVDGETGILVPCGNSEALADAIVNVLNDDELRKKLSNNAVKWSMNFSWDKTADKFLQVIKGFA
jgi:glycosyltransferase involved in cell wall biosynthesis